ncbi:lantibiotic dehydratase [Nocardiopsis sp. L17-MgMaSL7]|uniref:lantibiotic dehydratase n=1 Tax=Nocardiopsis sp. L17-MgMaSL7 TaxID=1938893 RepID=UPI0018F329F0|nr:lantibiotic dehydratase [Nocardiopsis sp. L17-MgMaSL7]
MDLLRAAVRDPHLVEAVTLASPSLAFVLDLVAQEREGELSDKRLRKAVVSVQRYDVRMRTRSTPFGLFAGVCAGRFDSAAKFAFGDAHRTRTRPDMEWLQEIVRRLESDPGVLRGLHIQAHQALLERGERIVLSAPSSKGLLNGASAFAEASIQATVPIRSVLKSVADPASFATVSASLAEEFQVAPEKGERMLKALVAQEFLITSLRPPLDGTDPLNHVLSELPRTGIRAESAHIRDELVAIDRSRHEYDALPIGKGLDALRALNSRVEAIQSVRTPVHVDTRLDATIRLPEQVRSEVERMAELLWRLSTPRLGMRALRDYHRRFTEHYGVDRLVPVLELLDENRGLGAPPGYDWPAAEAPEAPVEEASSAERNRVLARLVAEALRSGVREVELDEATFERLVYDRAEEADLPNSCELFVHVTSRSVDAMQRGEFRVAPAGIPGSHQAGATLARFADLIGDNEAEIDALGQQVPVQVRGAFAADLAFVPRSGRAANVVHVVPRTGRRISSGLPAGKGVEEVRLADIAVGATLERLCLVHLPSGREVVPVLPSMVSPQAQAPNVMRFLHEVGCEGMRLWEPWDWGPMAGAPFLPGVRYGRVQLIPPTWRLDPLVGATSATNSEWDRAVATWREDWRVPQRVLAVAADQRLLLDLDDPWDRNLLRDELRRNPETLVREVPGDADEGAGMGTGSPFMELVVPMVRRQPPSRPQFQGRLVPGRTRHGLGGPWLFLRLRVARRTQDELLRDHMPALADVAQRTGADRWFFMRYTEDGRHLLRVRFHGSPERIWAETAPEVGRLVSEWQTLGLAGEHQIGQYDPEFERYGGLDTQEAAERVFQEDSVAVLRVLRLLQGARKGFSLDAEEVAAVSLACLAQAFGPPGPPRPGPGWDRVSGLADDPAAAWLSVTGTHREVPGRYRSERERWRRLIDPAGGWRELRALPGGEALLGAFADRDSAVASYGALLRDQATPVTPVPRVVGSVMHMACNRLFGGGSERERDLLGIVRAAVNDHRNRRRHTS